MSEAEVSPMGMLQQQSKQLRALIERDASRDRDERLERTLKKVQDQVRKHIQRTTVLTQALLVLRGENLVGAGDLLAVAGKVDSLVKKSSPSRPA